MPLLSDHLIQVICPCLFAFKSTTFLTPIPSPYHNNSILVLIIQVLVTVLKASWPAIYLFIYHTTAVSDGKHHNMVKEAELLKQNVCKQ